MVEVHIYTLDWVAKHILDVVEKYPAAVGLYVIAGRDKHSPLSSGRTSEALNL